MVNITASLVALCVIPALCIAEAQTGDGERVRTSVSTSFSTSVSTSSRIRRLQGLSKSVKELEEKEKEAIESKNNKTEKEEENEIELEPPSSLRPGRGFRPSTKREQIRMKLHQSKKKKATGKPTRKLRLRARFRPSISPAEDEPEKLVQEKEEELEEGDKLLQSKLEELAVLEQQLEQLEEVMRQPKQVKEDDQVVPAAKKIRKRVKKRRRKPVKGDKVEIVMKGNFLGGEVEKKVRKIKKKEPTVVEDTLLGSRLPSVFLEPLEVTRSSQPQLRLSPSPSPRLSPSPTPRFSLTASPTLTPRFSPAPAPTPPPQPRAPPTPSFVPQPSSPAQPRLSPTPKFSLESQKIDPQVQTPTSPALPPSPKDPIPTSIPILRSPIQFAAPASSLPKIPSTRAPTRFSPSLNQIPQAPFPSAPLRPSSPSVPLRSPQAFPQFHLPDFFSLPFPEMRQGRSSPPGGAGGLFNAIGVPQVSRANGFNIGTGAYTLLIPL